MGKTKTKTKTKTATQYISEINVLKGALEDVKKESAQSIKDWVEVGKQYEADLLELDARLSRANTMVVEQGDRMSAYIEELELQHSQQVSNLFDRCAKWEKAAVKTALALGAIGEILTPEKQST